MEKKIEEYEKGSTKKLIDEMKVERGGKQYTYGEIDDDIITKRFFPLSHHLWGAYREMGYLFLEKFIPEVSGELIHDVVKVRLDGALEAAKHMVSGKNSHPEKSCVWNIFPPVVTLRGDLAQGTMKLLYGDSVDVSFVGIFDLTNEILAIFNGHMEDGVPVDWWVVGPDDELLQRRHRKLGIKLMDLPKKSKNINQMGARLTETLKDIRNERTPEWSTSDYNIAMVYGSGALSFFVEPSVYEIFGLLWDGINAKKVHGMKDSWFGFTPMPSLLNMFFNASRPESIKKFTGLNTANNLVVQMFEDEAKQIVMDLEPAIYKDFFEKGMRDGAYWPTQSLGCIPPKFKDKKTFENEETLRDWNYPAGNRITPESLGMAIDEFTKGIYFDINHETKPGSVDPKEKIVATGWGMNMDYR